MMIAAVFIAVVTIFVLLILEDRPHDDEGKPLLDEEFTEFRDWQWPDDEPDWRWGR